MFGGGSFSLVNICAQSVCYASGKWYYVGEGIVLGEHASSARIVARARWLGSRWRAGVEETMGDAAELAAIRAESEALRAELGMAEGEPVAAPAVVVDPSRFTHRMGCVYRVDAFGLTVRACFRGHDMGKGALTACFNSRRVHVAGSTPATSKQKSWGRVGEWNQ
eukprot:COSAG02_NODE_1694_length_11277_cov_36.084855_2_plen_165_part_00